ncbi:MAG: DNA polymerase IV [Planctomycetota bacterium]
MDLSRRIIHADMDAFYASVEQRDDPSLRGRPVVVAGLGRRGVVSAASYEARQFGIHSAQPTAAARRRCPTAAFVTPRMREYAAVSKQIRAIFDRYTPLVEPLSLDEAFLDVTGSERLFGSARQIAESLRAEVKEQTDLVISIGIATSKYVAKIASDLEKPKGFVEVPPGQEAKFLAVLPISRLWGAGKMTRQRLERVGIMTIGDLAGAPERLLRRLLGDTATDHFSRLIQGHDPRPVVSSRAAKTIGNERTFERDLRRPQDAQKVIAALCEEVGRRLRRSGVAGNTIRLKLRFPPFETITRQCRMPRAISDDQSLEETAQRLLRASWDRQRPLRLIGVTAADLEDCHSEEQLSLFEDRDDRRDRVMHTMDKIREKFGNQAIGRGASANNPLPDAATPADGLADLEVISEPTATKATRPSKAREPLSRKSEKDIAARLRDESAGHSSA